MSDGTASLLAAENLLRILDVDTKEIGIQPIVPEDEPKDWGRWGPTVALLRRLGAKVEVRGRGFQVFFDTFSLETQVYESRTVVAMNVSTRFELGKEMREREAFLVQFHGARVTDCAFGPIPDSDEQRDRINLARAYVAVLGALLEKHPRSLPSPSTAIGQAVSKLTLK